METQLLEYFYFHKQKHHNRSGFFFPSDTKSQSSQAAKHKRQKNFSNLDHEMLKSYRI